jgi:hypothetical protein
LRQDDLSGVGKWTSTRSLTQCAQSMRVRRALTLTYRQPRSGSHTRKTLHTPCRTYSLSSAPAAQARPAEAG